MASPIPLSRIKCNHHDVLNGVCVTSRGEETYCNDYFICDGIQIHKTGTGTGVGTYVDALQKIDNAFVTTANKKEWVIGGKKVGGYVTSIAGSHFRSREGRMQHASCNWSMGVHSDSVMVHDLNPLHLPGFFTARSMFRMQVRRLRQIPVFTPSFAVKEGVMRWLKVDPDHITVAAHGFDNELFHHSRKRYDLPPYLIYAGDFRPYKRVEEGIRLAAKLGMQFVRVGPSAVNDYGKNVAALGHKMLGSNYRDLGYVPKTMLAELYAGATANWFASKWEGFGLPALEAGGCGTPSILADTPVAHEVHRETGIYDMPKTIGDLEVDSRSVVRNARRYTWERSLQIHQERWTKEGLI